MSTPLDEQADLEGAKVSRLSLALRVLAAMAAVASLFALWSSERARVAHDLQLISEAFAKPGETLAVRALLLRDVEAPAGPTLAQEQVGLRLIDAGGRELAHTQLLPTITDSMEGAIRVPETADGLLTLEARVALGAGPPLVCRRTLQVSEDAPRLTPQGREAGPLQHFSVGPAHAIGNEPLPVPFAPRVVGGACLPEEPCTVLVWVGEPATAISLATSATVSQAAPPAPATETAGLVELTLITHGLEAEVTLEARRAGRLVAELPVRLPVALGAVGVFVRSPIAESSLGAELSFALPPGREHVIVDVFSGDRWRASRTLAHVSPKKATRLDPTLLVPGLMRVQARVDRFSGDGSGARLVYVRSPGEDDRTLLSRVATLVLDPQRSTEPTDRWARELPSFALADPARTVAYLLAPLESLRVPIPAAVSGRPAQLARLDRARTLMRFGVSGVLVLGALLVGVSLMRQGLSAADQARFIMDEACEGEAASGPAQLRGERLRVILLVLAVCLAFLAGALLIVAKPLWF